MKSLANFYLGSLLAAFILIHPSTARSQQAPGVVEILACNFINGSDAGDLQGPMNAFNRWMDQHDQHNFNVSTLAPLYTSDAFTYDVVFFNRWAGASEMGRSLGMLFGADGEEATAGFNDVVHCGSSAMFAAVLLKAPAEDRDGGPMQFFNCTVKENRTVGEGINAINRWAEATGSSRAGHAVLLPLAGENPDATYNFKWLVLHNSFEEYGDSLAGLFGPDAPSLGDIIEPVMDCDSARIYNQVINRHLEAND